MCGCVWQVMVASTLKAAAVVSAYAWVLAAHLSFSLRCNASENGGDGHFQGHFSWIHQLEDDDSDDDMSVEFVFESRNLRSTEDNQEVTMDPGIAGLQLPPMTWCDVQITPNAAQTDLHHRPVRAQGEQQQGGGRGDAGQGTSGTSNSGRGAGRGRGRGRGQGAPSRSNGNNNGTAHSGPHSNILVNEPGGQRTFWSLTFTRDGQDVNRMWLDPLSNWMQQHCLNGSAVALELGGRDHHLHFQGVLVMDLFSHPRHGRRVAALIRTHLQLTTQDNCRFTIKPFAPTQTWHCMLGHIQKDRNQPHFEIFTINVADEDLERGTRDYEAIAGEMDKGRTQINKNNMFSLAHLFLVREFATNGTPMDVDIVTALAWMLQSGKYTPGQTWWATQMQWVGQLTTSSARSFGGG